MDTSERNSIDSVRGQTTKSPGSIGLQVKISETKDLVVVYVVPGGSADKSGKVAAGDTLIKIDHIAVVGMSVETVAGLIVGEAGTAVRLRMASADKAREWNLTLIRL